MTDITKLPTEQLFDLFAAGISDQAICLLDQGGIVQVWNAGAVNFYRYTAAEIIGKSVSELLNGLEPAPYLKEAFAAGSASFEASVRRKDGSDIPAYLVFQPVYQEEQLQGYAFTARSLAYTRKLRYKFKDAGKKTQRPGLFQQLIEHSYSGITLFDADLNFIYRSPSAARITGFNDMGRATVGFKDIVHPADQARISALLDDLSQKPGTSISCSLRSRHFDGHFIDLEGVFTNWLQEPTINAIVLNFHDVSERRRAEELLQQTFSELSAYKYALDASAIVAITDQKGVIRYANANFCNISGYTERELLGQDHRLINSGYHTKDFIKEMWQTIASGKVWQGDFCNRRKDGSTYWVASTIVPFLNAQGKPYQYVSIRFDQTEARQAKHDLVVRNTQIDNLLESINDGFIALDHELRYTYVNRRICQMVGLTADLMLGRKVWELFPDAIGSDTWKAFEQARATGLPVTNEDYYAPLGLWQETRIYPNERGLSVFISDITWRKQEEEQKTLLADISDIFNQPASLPELMDQVMRRLLGLSSSCCLAETWLLGRDEKELILCAQTATSEAMYRFFHDHPDFRRLQAGGGLPGRTWSDGTLTFWTDLFQHPDFLRREAAKKAGLRSALGIPLSHNGRLIGVLVLGQTKAERAALPDNTMLLRLADHLGTAISRRQLENDLQDIFDAAPDIICIVGTDRYFKKINPAMCALLGYTEEELLQLPIDALVHPEDLAESQARMRRFITGELSLVYFENRYLSRSGKIIHFSWTAAKGKEEGVIFCIAKNISDQKELERLLRKASELARIGTWEINLLKDEIFWSDVTAEIIEVAPDFRPVRGNASLFYAPADLERLNTALAAVMQGGAPFDLELELITAKEKRRWVRVLGEGEIESGQCIRVYGSLQDIDARKRAQEAANRLLAERNTILESIGDAFFSVDREWKVQYWNQVAEEVLQTPKEMILGRNLWSVFENEINSEAYVHYHKAMASGEVRHFENYYEPLTKWYDVSVYPSVSGLAIFFKDITLRKNAEIDLQRQAEALEVSHQRYSDLFQLSPLPKFVFDVETLSFLDVNKAAVNHYGYSREEFLKMTLRDIRPQEELQRLENVVKNTSRSPYFYKPGTFTHRKKNGDLIRVDITSSALDYNGRPARIALAADVTERLEHLEAIELQNKKLREISWMQSHVIRAPLSRIMGLVELMNSSAPGLEETKRILEYIKISANELDDVIRSITDNAWNKDDKK